MKAVRQEEENPILLVIFMNEKINAFTLIFKPISRAIETRGTIKKQIDFECNFPIITFAIRLFPLEVGADKIKFLRGQIDVLSAVSTANAFKIH